MNMERSKIYKTILLSETLSTLIKVKKNRGTLIILTSTYKKSPNTTTVKTESQCKTFTIAKQTSTSYPR
jgi:hypothetical protein